MSIPTTYGLLIVKYFEVKILVRSRIFHDVGETVGEKAAISDDIDIIHLYPKGKYNTIFLVSKDFFISFLKKVEI